MRQRLDRLLRMHGAWRRDNDAVDIRCEYLIDSGYNLAVGRELLRFRCHVRRRIGYCNNIGDIGLDDRLHAMPANPADAEKAQTRSHGMTRAFKNSPGLSRVASSALSS